MGGLHVFGRAWLRGPSEGQGARADSGLDRLCYKNGPFVSSGRVICQLTAKNELPPCILLFTNWVVPKYRRPLLP